MPAFYESSPRHHMLEAEAHTHLQCPKEYNDEEWEH